jgi:ketosteroid isomerase-like protein
VGASGDQRCVGRWWSVLLLAGSLAAGVPLAASAGTEPESDRSTAEQEMVAAARAGSERFRELWNANKLDQLVAEIYTEASVLVPPNHDAIRGRAPIREYLEQARAQLGEYSKADASCHPTSSETLVTLRCEYNFRSGTLRFNATEAWQRHPDGSVRNMVDMFGFR